MELFKIYENINCVDYCFCAKYENSLLISKFYSDRKIFKQMIYYYNFTNQKFGRFILAFSLNRLKMLAFFHNLQTLHFRFPKYH